MNEDQEFNNLVEKKLNSVSCSFCLAKWKQVTLHLGTGHTHSCHHPRTHKIPLEEIKENPSALHNTNYKKIQRKMMLEGTRPPECNYCWNVEDAIKAEGNDVIKSDRIYKSGDSWARKYFYEVAESDWKDDVNPSYLEVSFSNVCNFKCGYCNPENSSKWMEEIKQFGAYPTRDNFNDLEWTKSQDKMPIPENQDNPYVEAFWKWWPDLYKDLHTFRITGGEPLLNKNTFRVLDWLIENPQPKLDLAVNSNLCVPKELLDKFLEKVNILISSGHCRSFKLYTSNEAYGNKAEYIRFGLNYNDWLENCERFLQIPGRTKLVCMAAYNFLSISSFKNLLEDIKFLKDKYTSEETKERVAIDIPYLNNPKFLSINLVTPEFTPYIEDSIQYAKNNNFAKWEVDKLERILMLANNAVTDDLLNVDFKKYIMEHDRRRNTNFLETFPEYKDFYESISA